MAGTLFVVATPIGNLEDITFRAVRVLREASVVAAEDTRRTGLLLHHFGISVPLISLHEHNEGQRAELLIGRLNRGESVALVSDAGTPAVSDPGAKARGGRRGGWHSGGASAGRQRGHGGAVGGRSGGRGVHVPRISAS